MPTTRRQFIKRSAGAVSVSLLMPKLLLARSQDVGATDRKITVVIQLGGGNDGLNTVVPYTDARYHTLRPTLGWNDTELKDATGKSTIISPEFGLHPGLTEIKDLYDAGRVGIVLGVGYPSANLSHFLSTDIWATANTNGGIGDGWLGKYADLALAGKSGITAASIGGALPKAFFADKVVIPSISNFAQYTYQTDGRFAGDRNNQLNAFRANNHRTFEPASFLAASAMTGLDAVDGAAALNAAVGAYTSTVTYPANNSLAAALKMAAQMITTLPDANLLYVQLGGFDHHSAEIGNNQTPTDKTIGQHMNLLRSFSQGVKAFLDDMAAHGLEENVLLMTFSEFGRRPNENASHGTDHGTAAPQFVIGKPVKGGLYGAQPSLATTSLDSGGNMRFTTDFRSIYSTVLDKWLGSDSRAVLGATFPNLGFL